MKINLHEILEEGQEFVYNRNTAELNEVLHDLISTTPFEIKIFIKPLMKGFEMTGKIDTDSPQLCSRCGEDFPFEIHRKLKELLLPKEDEPRNSHYTKANHFSELDDQSLSVFFYEDPYFDLGEYLHEVIALEIPFNPKPKVDTNGRCGLCKVDVSTLPLKYEDPMEDEKKSPFDALKGLNLQ